MPFTAVVLDINGAAVEEAPVDWSSSAQTVGTVSPEGVVAALALGITTITATSGPAADSVRISVGPAAIGEEYEALRTIYHELGGWSWKESANWLTNQRLDSWSRVEIDPAGFVTRLRLADNDLTGILPPEIGAFTRLRLLDIDLNWNVTGALSPEIGNLKALRVLKLSSTGVSGPIPGEIGELAALEYLLLHRTRLTTIPPEIGNLANLVAFHGYQGKLEGPLPATIGRLDNLKELFLNQNGLSGLIPRGIGDMAALERLHLDDNDFSGAIPSGLADAPHLSVLRLSGNRLTRLPPELGEARNLRWLTVEKNELSGPIPPWIGSLPVLERLELQENRLTGPVPAELGSARALTMAGLSRNRLSGRIPAELGKLKSLEQLLLAHNPDLTGPLPPELTGVQNLGVLLLGGTDVCAPADPEFQTWLRGIPHAYVRRCLDTGGSVAYLTQAVQSPEYPVPLIAGDSALLRVFVVSEKGAEANVGVPPARATFYLGGSEVHVVHFDGADARIPAVLNESDLNLSLNSVIPGSVVQPALEMVVEIDPEGTLDPGLEIAERIPASGRTVVHVEVVPEYELTFITFLWTEAPDSALLAKVNGLTPDSPLLWATREFLPVNEVSVTHHDPIWLDENPSVGIMGQIIFATLAAKQAAGGRGHWVGVWSGCCGGASFQIQTAGVGLEPTAPDRFWQNNNVLAHELGHLMTLPHAPCNVGDPDPNFPHPNGLIGSWGYDMRSNELRDPTSPEVMSYCGEREKWVSGFYHSQALSWRLRHGASESSPRTAVRSLMLWGGVQPDGEVVLEPAFVLDAVPTAFVQPGPYRLTGKDRQGREVFSYSLSMSPLDAGGAGFVHMLPVEAHWEFVLDRIELSGPGGSLEVLRDGPTTSVLLTDPRTGRIRGFLRHGPDVEALRDEAQADAWLRALVPERVWWRSSAGGFPRRGTGDGRRHRWRRRRARRRIGSLTATIYSCMIYIVVLSLWRCPTSPTLRRLRRVTGHRAGRRPAWLQLHRASGGRKW